MPQPDSSPALTLSMPQAFALCCKAAGPLRVRVLNRATGVEEAYAIGAPYAFIGRSSACGVRLDDPSVSQCHAYLQVVEGAPYCIDLGSRAGVIWEDGTQGQGWVGPEQALRIGVFDVRVEGPHAPPLAAPLDHDSDHDHEPALPTAFVELHATATGTGRLHPLDRPITLVGRHPTCDLRLIDEPLAYFQCALVNTSDGLWLVDTLTPKGATLNGRGTRLARVRDGDLIEIGKVSLLVRIGAHHANRAALAKSSDAGGLDPVAMISARVAESVAGAFVPVGEMMKQFQQCFVTMAQMFASMQQDHAAVVSDQLRQLQEMAGELRELRAEVRRGTAPPTAAPAPSPPAAAHEPAPARPAPPPAPAQPTAETTPAPRNPNPSLKPPVGTESQTLADAHSWFMDRLLNKGQNPPAGS
jgi:predicted component of type VI protein secretion system